MKINRSTRWIIRRSVCLKSAVLLVLLIPGTSAPSFSQTGKSETAASPADKTQPKAPPGPAQPSPAPTAIAATELARGAEAASLRLRRIRTEVDKTFHVSDAQEQLSNLARSINRVAPLSESSYDLHTEELSDLRQELLRFSSQLQELQERLTPRSQALEARRNEVQQMEVVWKLTLASLVKQEAPRTSRELILSLLNEIEDTANLLRARRPALLTLQDRISEKRIALDDMLAQTDAAQAQRKAELLMRDSQPLWNASWSTRAGESMAGSIQRIWLRRAQPLFDYMKDATARVYVHLLLLLIFLSLSISVSRKGRSWIAHEGAASEARSVLHHPVAAALIVSLLSTFYIYPNAPISLYRLPLLLIVFPLLFLLSGSLPAERRAAFHLLTGLYLARRLDELIAVDSLLHRILLLALAAGGLFGVVWASRSDRRVPGPDSWNRLRIRLVHLAGLILLVSVIANVAGNVTLATLLVEGCISSAFWAVALFAGVLAFEGFLPPLLNSPLARLSRTVRNHHDVLLRRGVFLSRLAALAIWSLRTLKIFGILGPIQEAVTSVLGKKWSFGAITFSLGGILLFLLAIWLSALIARFGSLIVEDDVLSRFSLPRGVPETASMLVRYSIVVFGFILALAVAGVQWSQIALIAGAVGIGVGLGLQNLVASFIAGLILIFERPIRVGDEVEVGRIMGVVTRVGLRSSTIQTYDGSEVICPNSNLISQELVNWTLSNQVRRISVQVGVAYKSNPDVVLTVLRDVVREHPGVRQTPEPVALFLGFGESSLNFVLRFFVSFIGWPAMSSEIGIRIHKALGDAGIEIPFPQRDIRITSELKDFNHEVVTARSEGSGKGPQS